MGLARIAGTHFLNWGPQFQTIMMSIIMINMLVGPPMFRHALIAVGEARYGLLPGLHRDDSNAGVVARGEIDKKDHKKDHDVTEVVLVSGSGTGAVERPHDHTMRPGSTPPGSTYTVVHDS